MSETKKEEYATFDEIKATTDEMKKLGILKDEVTITDVGGKGSIEITLEDHKRTLDFLTNDLKKLGNMINDVKTWRQDIAHIKGKQADEGRALFDRTLKRFYETREAAEEAVREISKLISCQIKKNSS